MFAAHYRIPEDKPLGSVHTYQWERAALSPPPAFLDPASFSCRLLPRHPSGTRAGNTRDPTKRTKNSRAVLDVQGEEGVWDWYVPSLVGNDRRELPKKLESTGTIFFRSPGWTRSFPGKIYSRRPSLLSSCPKREIVKMVAVRELSNLLVWMEQ